MDKPWTETCNGGQTTCGLCERPCSLEASCPCGCHPATAGTFELFYSSGGHSGPYQSCDAARIRALALLKGRPAEHHIEIRESSTSVVFIERIYQSNPCPTCGRTGAVQDAPAGRPWPKFGEDWR